MIELSDFFNEGFGWVCRHCDREDRVSSGAAASSSRLMTEGEAETKAPKMSVSALAKWADAARRTLMCPRCGITELVDIG